MFFPDEKIVNEIKETFTEGARVELIHMDDPYVSIPKGTKGTVKRVDDTGTIHVSWDTGNCLGIVYGVDECKKL